MVDPGQRCAVGQCGLENCCVPLSRAMAEELLGGDYLQADETPVGVQIHDGRGQNHQTYLWQYSRPGGAVIFDFQLSRSREGPKRFLGNYEGILQTDVTAAMIEWAVRN
jgi:transposase